MEKLKRKVIVQEGMSNNRWHRTRESVFNMCFIIFMIVVLCITLIAPLKSYGQIQEYELKAAFLFNFAKFVEWPEASFNDEKAPLVLCVFGHDPFGENLDAMKGKIINGRRLEVRRTAEVQNLDQCHILFISSSETDRLPEILRIVKQWNVLTIGDARGFSHKGGIINLIKAGDKIGFEINIAAAEKANLKISSKLLKLGNIVK